MSIFNRSIAKTIKKHYSLDSLRKGKGLIGWYNPKRWARGLGDLKTGITKGTWVSNVGKTLTGVKRTVVSPNTAVGSVNSSYVGNTGFRRMV